MKKTALILGFFLLGIMVMGLFLISGTASAGQNDPSAKLLGKWTVADKFGKGDGEAEFNADNTYILTEIHPDGTGVTHKGQYKLDLSRKPYAIDLCVGECGVPGSEWTTTFGVLRFISDDKAEIHFDPSGQRPASFDNTEDANIHQLTRKAE